MTTILVLAGEIDPTVRVESRLKRKTCRHDKLRDVYVRLDASCIYRNHATQHMARVA